MAAPQLVDFDWKLLHVVASSSAASIGAPLLRLQLCTAGAAARRRNPTP